MIQVGLIDEFVEAIKNAISEGVSTVFSPFQWILDWSPLFGHFLLFALLFVALFVIAYFLPFKWVRASLGFILVVAGAFLAGESHELKRHLDEQRKKKAEEKKRTPPVAKTGGRGLFG